MKLKIATVGMIAFVAAVSPACATTISVQNFSFETLPVGGLPSSCGTGCAFSVDNIPNWTRDPSALPVKSGQFQPGGSGAIFNLLPDGSTAAFSNGDNLLQTVGVTAQLGATYTLQVDVGFRKDLGSGGSVGLRFGSDPNNTYFATGIPAPLTGNWVTYTLIHTATALDSGLAMTIVLGGTVQGFTQADYDNVRLSVEAPAATTPLPAALPLFAAGLGALGLLGRHRKKKKAALWSER